MPNGRIDVKTYFDSYGHRTCATDFTNGNVCAYYRAQKFGTQETCVFAPKHNKYAEQLHRRGDNGLGSLIPAPWCPIKVIDN